MRKFLQYIGRALAVAAGIILFLLLAAMLLGVLFGIASSIDNPPINYPG